MIEKRDPHFREGAHDCLLDSDYTAYGAAIDGCTEDTEGRLWAGNDEYGSQVNFCPVCGFETKTKVKK